MCVEKPTVAIADAASPDIHLFDATTSDKYGIITTVKVHSSPVTAIAYNK